MRRPHQPASRLRRDARPACALALALLGACGHSAAADRYWSPSCIAAFWTDPCWTNQWNLPPLGLPPATGDRAILRHLGQDALVVQYRGNSLPLAGLEMDALGAGNVLLLQAQGSLDVATAVIGQSGRASYRGMAGQLLVRQDMLLARDAGANGRLELSGTASLDLGSLVLGRQGRGEVQHDGGAVVVQQNLVLGEQTGASSRYELNGGSLQVKGRVLNQGGSRFQWEGGTLDLQGPVQWDLASFADRAGSQVAFEHRTGQSVRANTLLLGGEGSGHYSQAGGTLSVGKRVELATATGGQGQFTLSGGEAQLQQLLVGVRGQGTVAVQGGQLSVQNITLAHEAGSNGLLHLQAGTTHLPGGLQGGAGFSELRWDAGATLVTPRIEGINRLAFTGPVGTVLPFQITDGTTIRSASTTLDGGLTLVQTGGVHEVSGNLVIGQTLAHAPTLYHLQGGRLSVGALARPQASAPWLILDGGEFVHAGSVSVHRMDIARAAGSAMSFRLDDGQNLQVSDLYLSSPLGGGQARFVQAGGRVETREGGGATLGLYGDSQYLLANGSAKFSYVNVIGPAAELRLNGGRIDVTTWFGLDGGRFTLSGPGFMETTQGLQLINAGQLQVNNGGLTVKGALDLRDGSVTVAGGRLTVRGGLVNGSGHGRLLWQGGELEIEHNSFAVDELHIGAGLTLARNSSQDLQVSGLLHNEGRLELLTAARIGRLEQQGTLSFEGGTLRVGALQGDGRFLLHGSGSRLVIEGDAALQAGASLDLWSTARVQVEGRLTLDAATAWQGGTLEVLGGLDLAGAAPASFTLGGSLVLGDAATLRVDLFGQQADHWQVAERLHLGGTLQLVAGEGFGPQAGTSFQLFEAGSLEAGSWRLDTHAAPLAPGLRWDDSQLAIDGSLRVSAVPEPEAAWLMLAGLIWLGVARRRMARASGS